MNQDAFFRLHSGLPRESPGSEASTRRAIEMLPKGFSPRAIADMGCGPGMSTIVLAESFPKASVLAVDTHQPYLDQLSARAEAVGVQSRISLANVSLEDIGEAPGSFDLIWAEGSAYLLGVERSLTLWRPLLGAGGCIAFTELSWLTLDPPEAAVTYWQEVYPDMNTESGIASIASGLGFDVLGKFTLPSSDWWSEYFSPLQRRINLLRSEQESNIEEGMHEVLDEAEDEINAYSVFGGCFGYVFYVLQLAA